MGSHNLPSGLEFARTTPDSGRHDAYDYSFIRKDTVQDLPNGRDTQDQVWGGAQSSRALSGGPLSRHMGTFTNMDATPLHHFTVLNSLHYIGLID